MDLKPFDSGDIEFLFRWNNDPPYSGSMNHLSRFRGKNSRARVKSLNQEEYASFSSALNDVIIQEIRKLAESKGLTIEEYIVTLVKDRFDEIRGKKDNTQH